MSAFNAQAEPLSLSQALILADKSNPQILAAQKGLDVSQANVQVAGQRLNPQVNTYYGFGRTTTVLANPQQAGVEQTIETGGKRKKRVLVAKAQYQVDDQQLVALRWNIRSQVRFAYIDMVSAEATIHAIQDQAILLQGLVNIAEKRMLAGAASEAEVLQANLAKKQVDSLMFQAQSQLEQSRIHLNALLGNQMPPQFSVSYHDFFKPSSGDVDLFPALSQPLPPTDQLVTQALQNRPDLKALVLQTEVGRNQLSLARTQKIPNLQLGVGLLALGGPFLNVPVKYSPTQKQDFFIGGYTSVSLEIPILNQYKGEVQHAKATMEQATLQASALRIQIQDEVAQAAVALENSRRSIQNYTTQLLPAATEVVMLAQKSYQYGKTGLASVIVAQQSERQIQQGYLEEIARYQRAWADLERAYGRELSL